MHGIEYQHRLINIRLSCALKPKLQFSKFIELDMCSRSLFTNGGYSLNYFTTDTSIKLTDQIWKIVNGLIMKMLTILVREVLGKNHILFAFIVGTTKE